MVCVPLERVFAAARSIAQLAYVCLLPVSRFLVPLEVTYTAELPIAPAAYPAFLRCPGLL